jgi:hypothetical protein
MIIGLMRKKLFLSTYGFDYSFENKIMLFINKFRRLCFTLFFLISTKQKIESNSENVKGSVSIFDNFIGFYSKKLINLEKEINF